MSACSLLTYDKVTPAAWACGVRFAAGHGVQISANKGQASASGFTIAWDYDPAARTVSLQCTDSPFLVPCSVINAFIDRTVQNCLSLDDAAPAATA